MHGSKIDVRTPSKLQTVKVSQPEQADRPQNRFSPARVEPEGAQVQIAVNPGRNTPVGNSAQSTPVRQITRTPCQWGGVKLRKLKKMVKKGTKKMNVVKMWPKTRVQKSQTWPQFGLFQRVCECVALPPLVCRQILAVVQVAPTEHSWYHDMSTTHDIMTAHPHP